MDELSQLPSRVARLESDVDHIKRDVADIKVDIRRLDDRMRGLAKVWALSLYVGLAASMLFVMAKGFKWI